MCPPLHQGIDPIHQTRVVEILKDTEGDRRRSRDSLTSVKYESGSETGEEVSMGVEWNGVSTNPLQTSLSGPGRGLTGRTVQSAWWPGTDELSQSQRGNGSGR